MKRQKRKEKGTTAMKKSDYIWTVCVLGTAILATATTLTFADAYKWEENNIIQYTQTPPSGQESTYFPAPPLMPVSPEQQRKQAKLEENLSPENVQTMEEQAIQESEAQASRIKEFNCNQYQKYLEKLHSKERIKLIDISGNETILGPEERKLEIQKTETLIQKDCH